MRMKAGDKDGDKSRKDTIRIVVIDNDDIVCSAICSDLEKDDRFEAIGVNPDKEAALERVKREQPHVILLDLMWNNQLRGGWNLLPEISKDCPHTAVIIVSARAELADVSEAWRKGIAGYVPKRQWQEELTEAILAVSKGGSFFSPSVGKRVWKPSKETESLNPREREAYYLSVRDLSSQAIAEEMSIVIDTVHVHRSHIRERIGHPDGWRGIARDAQKDPDLLCELLDKERRVFELYVQGQYVLGARAIQDIATKLSCSETEVTGFIRNIRRKLNCHPDGWKGIAREEGDID